MRQFTKCEDEKRKVKRKCCIYKKRSDYNLLNLGQWYDSEKVKKGTKKRRKEKGKSRGSYNRFPKQKKKLTIKG